MIFACRTFPGAGLYGLVVLLPMYFLEGRIGRDTPPPITHSGFLRQELGPGKKPSPPSREQRDPRIPPAG